MGLLTVDEILKATGGAVFCGDAAEFTGVSIDSRSINPGELFIALKGERFDGHDFLRASLAAGGGAIVERPPAERVEGKTIILAGDTLTALQDIARHLRRKRNIPVIGVTGTNGKTTTKELIASVLGRRHKILKTTGNLNNHIGLPLCIANMEGDETAMVLEMGSNAEGDIRLLCEVGLPDYAVVTNVGPAHLEGFGSIETVRKTDLEILEYAGTVVINADDSFLMEGLKGFSGKTITYGIEQKADVLARDITAGGRGAAFRLCFPDGGDMDIELSIPGRFNVYNALAASAIASELGMGKDDIRRGLESFSGVPLRLEIRHIMGATVISDVYNANPASMEAALQELVRLKKGRAIAVLGDMLELGSHAEAEHRRLVARLAEEGVGVLVAVGSEMRRAAAGFSDAVYLAENADAARDILLGICKAGDTVLVKGSRGMRMERVLAGRAVAVRKEGNHAL